MVVKNAYINSDLAKQAQLLKENGRFRWVDIAFIEDTTPSTATTIEAYKTVGAKQIVVVPWLLFSGERVDSLFAQIEDVKQKASVATRIESPVAEQDGLIEILVSHYQTALEDRSLLPVSWKALQWQITAEMEAEHKQKPGEVAADEADFQTMLGKINDILPPRYQNQENPTPTDVVTQTELIVTEDGSVQWEQMFGLGDNQLGDLALAGGHSYRETLLEAVNPDDCVADMESYTAVCDNLTQGIHTITGLDIVKSNTVGWIGVQCDSEEMAIWLVRAIIVENVMVRREGNIIFLPASPHYQLQEEILSIVTVIVKTWRFWIEHITAQQWQINDEQVL